MITAKFLETMALYNQWQNENLFSLCDPLSDEQLRLDRGMFFNSIFNTLNHILYVDETIYRLIHTKILFPFDPSQIPYSKYRELKSARFAYDARLLQDAQRSQDWLDEKIEFWSERLNRYRSIPRSFYYMQLFNHQTHYRSQITAEFHRL